MWGQSARGKRFWPHLMNFSRRWKLPGNEVGIILNEVTDPQWQACQDPPVTCLEKAPSSGTVENMLVGPTLCGDVGIVRQPPIPWAWSQASDETEMPSEVLRLQGPCHDELATGNARAAGAAMVRQEPS